MQLVQDHIYESRNHGSDFVSEAFVSSFFDPYQVEWYNDENEIKLADKSRRTGITFATACKAVTNAITGKCSTYYMCQKEVTAQKFIKECAKITRAINRAIVASGLPSIIDVESRKPIKATKIDYLSGCEIELLSSNPDSARGLQGDVVLDEFAAMPYGMQALAAARALDTLGGRISIISTHQGEHNPFNVLCQQAQAQTPGDVDSPNYISYHRITLIDATRQGYYKRVCRNRGIEWTQEKEDKWLRRKLAEPDAAQEYLCIPSKVGENYIPREMVEACMYGGRVVRLRLEEGFEGKSESEQIKFMADWYRLNVQADFRREYREHEVYLGWDFARSPKGDLSVIVPFRLNKDLVRHAPIVIEMKGVPHNRQIELIRMMAPDMPRIRKGFIDAGAAGNYVGDETLKIFGASRWEKISVGRSFYRENFPALRAGFESRKMLLPADAELLSDFAVVTLDNGEPIVPRIKANSGVMGSRHADAAVAVLLAYAASRVPKPSFDLKTPKNYPERGDKWRFM